MRSCAGQFRSAGRRPGRERDATVIASTGTILGFVGDYGNSKGIKASSVHLHFEFRNRELGGNGTTDRIDPVQFYGDPPYDGLYYIDDE